MSGAPQEDVRPWIDPIVAEVRAAREQLFAAAGYDLEELCRRLRAQQAAGGRSVVIRPARPVNAQTDTVV